MDWVRESSTCFAYYCYLVRATLKRNVCLFVAFWRNNILLVPAVFPSGIFCCRLKDLKEEGSLLGISPAKLTLWCSWKISSLLTLLIPLLWSDFMLLRLLRFEDENVIEVKIKLTYRRLFSLPRLFLWENVINYNTEYWDSSLFFCIRFGCKLWHGFVGAIS